MSSPINMSINLPFLKNLIAEIDIITNSSFPYEKILDDILDFINKHTLVYEFKYDGDDKDIKNILIELNDIKTIFYSNKTNNFKVDTIILISIYRSYE